MLRIGLISFLAFATNFCAFSVSAQSDTELRRTFKAEKTLQNMSKAWKNECGNGAASSCLKLADFIRTRSIKKSQLKSLVGLYGQACDQRLAEGCDGLGRVYNVGIGTDINHEKARKAYEKGCKLGNTRSCAAYGNLVFRGIGGERDTYKGGLYLRQACDEGYEWACETGCILGARGVKACS